MFVQTLKIENQLMKISGDGLYQAQVNHRSSFVLHSNSPFHQLEEVKVITHPSEYPCEIEILDDNNNNGTWIVNYIPKAIGQIQIEILLDDQQAYTIPYQINIFDVNQIHISKLTDGYVNQWMTFLIDTSRAGVGQLEIQVNNGQIACDILSRITSQYEVTFLPRHSGSYQIDIKFNGLIIPGSPFLCCIHDLTPVIVSNHIRYAQVEREYSFDIESPHKTFDVHIRAPSGRSVSFQRLLLNESQTRIDYVLDEIGRHEMNVRSDTNMSVYGGSFSIQAYDIHRVIVSDIPHFLTVNQSVQFTVDVSKVGEGQLEVDINNGSIPNQIKVLGNNIFQFTFVPIRNELYQISVKFNGEQIPNFPKECEVIPTDSLEIHGPSLYQVLLNTPTWLNINTIHDGSSDLQVTITTPKNEQFIPSTLLTSAGLRIDWTPREIGTYFIEAISKNYPISGSPFQVKCYDPKKVLVIPPINNSSIHKPTKFIIDTAHAGEGHLEVRVNCAGLNLSTEINPIAHRQFEVQFTPQKAIIHQCNIFFNGELIPGTPLTINVMDIERILAIGKGLGSIPVHVSTSFTILTQHSFNKDLKCSIKGPDDRLISCILTKVDPNRYEVIYTPDRVGEYHIDILSNDISIDGSPFIARSFDVTKIRIEDFPSATLIGSPTYFLIDATDSGSGNLEIAISKDGRNIPNQVLNEGGARFRIKFIPNQPAVHHVQIKFNGIEIPGSPVLCHVYSTDFTFENYEYAPIHKQTSFLIKPRSNSMFNQNIHVDIISPLGQKILRRMSLNAHIDFIPNEIGPHEIRFYHIEDKRILLGRFICYVYDISKIRISDLPIANAHRRYRFTINTSNVGQGILIVKIKQNEKKINHEQTRISMNMYEISFIPETAEDCSVQIIFNGENSLRTLIIPVKIDDKQICVSSIPPGIVGQPVVFTLDVIDINLLSISITESHSNRIVSHTMTRISTDENRYEISFIPYTTRQHTISIFYADKLYSTYHVDICNLKKIRVSAIDDGIVGVPSIFSVDTHGAGEGHLEVVISDGQRTLPAELKSVQTRRFDISFIPEITGEHTIGISFNGIPIEGSPFKIQIDEPSISVSEEDDHEFVLGGQLEGTKVGEIAWLICETSLTEIYEDLDLYITDPDALIIKHTRIQDSAGRWRIEFEPIKPGIYQIQTDVDQSTIILASAEILPIDYERTIYAERIVHPNVLNFLSIHSSNDNLKIQLRSSNGDDIPMEIDRDSSEWKVQFTLPDIDCYELVILNGTTTNERKFEIYCVAEETDLLRNGGIEDIARIIIHHSKLTSDDVNVIVKDPFAHTIPAAFYRNLDNDLIIEYIPVRPDIHEVFIRTQNNLLDICPMRLLAFQAQNTFDPVLRVQVKEILEHTFSGVVDHDRKLDITITDPFERSIAFERWENPRGELTISLSPIRVGTHWMRISNDDDDSFALIPIFAFDDDYIPLSPVGTPSIEEKDTQTRETSDIEPIPLMRDITTISETSDFLSMRTASRSPEQNITSVRDSSTNTMPIIDGRISPELQILDMVDLVDPIVRTISTFTFKDPNNQLNTRIYDANENEVIHRVEQLTDGRKSISYEVTIVGPVEIHFFKGHQTIDGSPLIVNAFDPSAVQLLDFPKKILINTVNSFLLDVTHAGKGSLKITIKDPTNRSLSVNLEKHLNNQIGIQFKPIISGIHIISILFNRVPIPKTPIEIFVENSEERGRSVYSKHQLMSLSQPQERLISISPQSIYSPSSIEHEIFSQKELSQPKLDEKRPEEYPPFTEQEIKRFEILKQKFEQQQPIDIVFDPRRYPFKIYLSDLLPLINTDIHLLVEFPHFVHVDIILKEVRIPFHIIQKTLQGFLLRFRPIFAGDYFIILKDVHGQSLIGSPYILPIYNPNGIRIESFDSLQPIHDCYFICNIDNIGQGKFFLMIYHESKPIKISYRIQSLTNTRIRVSFRPWQIGNYRIYLAYRNFPIHGLPIDIVIYDPEGVLVTAEHKEPVVVKTTVAYKVNKRQAGQGQIKAELIPPETSIIPCRCHVHELNEDEHLIEYIPHEPGRYKLQIFFNNQLVQGKTMDIDVYSLLPAPVLSSTEVDVQKILPKDTPRIGDEICLQILTEKSSIDGQVNCDGVSVPCQIQRTDNKRLWHLKFRPYTAGIYNIHLFHLGSSIMHSPYLIQVKDINGKNYLSGVVNIPCMIQIHTKFTSNSQIRAVVLLDNREIPSTMSLLHDNLIRIHFTPDESGICFVHIYNENQSIEGSPFLIRIKQPQMVEITGKCLERLRVNDLGIFRVHCHGQRGTIKAKIFYLSVDDCSEVGQLISFQLSESYEQLTQFPTQIFLTSMTILLTARLRLTQERIRNLTLEEDNGHAVISFQLFEISNQSPSNEQIINGLRSLIDKRILNLIDPNRNLLHVICGSLMIAPKGEPINIKFFTLPNGDYLGEFTPKKLGQYRIDVIFNNEPIDGSPFFPETYDTSQVHIENLPKEIIVGTENTFDINTNQAGNAPLEVMITSPSANNVPCKIDERLKIKRVRFTPNEIGLHHLDIKFGSDQIPGTPIKLMVKNTELITAYGEGLHQSVQNSIASFFVDTKEMEGDLYVRIEDSNTLIENTLQRINKSLFKINYTPLEVGYINITIKWNGKDILNSPFNGIVINPGRVRLAVSDERSLFDSDNHMHVKINEEKKLRFDTSQAGPGTLKATIENVKKDFIPIRIDQQSTVYTLSFTVIRGGHYDLMITYGDYPLPNMPIRLVASSGMSDHSSTVYVSSDDLTSHTVSQVICSGDGLRMGIIGQERKCLIDTRHANPGELTAYCQGNHKIAICRLFDHGDGTFTLFIKPQESGKHLLTIKYNGEHVPGSPFTVRVSGPPDARKVRVYGPGIQSGVLSSFQSHFICETKGAGAGQLTVKIRGPKGAFRVEMKREHIQDRTITCRYYPTEPGDYLLSVKWSGEHVYGSPFHARIFETEDEFNAYQYEVQASRLLGHQRSDERE